MLQSMTAILPRLGPCVCMFISGHGFMCSRVSVCVDCADIHFHGHSHGHGQCGLCGRIFSLVDFTVTVTVTVKCELCGYTRSGCRLIKVDPPQGESLKRVDTVVVSKESQGQQQDVEEERWWCVCHN